MQFVLVTEARDYLDLPGELVPARVPLAEVNWQREVALVVDLGEKRTGGFNVKVLDVNLHGGDEVELTLELHRPGPGQMVAQVLTHPFTVCRLPRLGLRPGAVTIVGRERSGAEVARQVVEW